MANSVARHLRKNQTIAEAVLWKELRQLRREGYHFRRQAPIDAFIVDFACLAHRLVIEVDGIQHDEAHERSKDAARDARLTWLGYKVLRFWNSEVMDEREGVMLEILAALGNIERHD